MIVLVAGSRGWARARGSRNTCDIVTTPDNVVLIGNTSPRALRSMLEDRGYRDRTAVLETSWLDTGRVDEMLSVVRTNKNRFGYVLAAADPIKALQLIRDASKSQLTEIEDAGSRDLLRKVHDYLAPKNTPLRLPSARRMQGLIRDYLDVAGNRRASEKRRTALLKQLLREFDENLFVRRWNDWSVPSFIVKNLKAADHIANNVAKVKSTTARVRAQGGRGGSGADARLDVVSYPQLYAGRYFKRSSSFQQFSALNPNVVNQLVLGEHTLARDEPYHRFGGGIHSATNDLRVPRPAARCTGARLAGPMPHSSSQHCRASGSGRAAPPDKGRAGSRRPIRKARSPWFRPPWVSSRSRSPRP